VYCDCFPETFVSSVYILAVTRRSIAINNLVLIVGVVGDVPGLH
jgi:hypothetical protein